MPIARLLNCRPPRLVARAARSGRPADVVLSSGFLAFAAHAGFMAGLERAGVRPEALMGTSSGALVAALYAAGWAPHAIAEELLRAPPISYLEGSSTPWMGLLALDGAVRRLERLLPARFEDLPCELTVGVVDGGRHRLVGSGPLAVAVAASMAVPGLFAPVVLDGRPCSDGGAADRIGLEPWLRARGARRRPVAVHVVQRSTPLSGANATPPLSGVVYTHSPRANQSLLALPRGQFEAQFATAAAAGGVAGLLLERTRPELGDGPAAHASDMLD